ncbi:hypothetical protein [Caldivirga sp.]|uniref:hypothetical protein n=1 Tax=Caldivirga sp. TaxID=2080243 RepID=UPI003D0CCCBC
MQPYIELVRRYVYRRILIEFGDDELGKLAVAILNTLLSRGEAMTDDKLTSIVGYNAIDVRRILQALYNMRLASVVEEFNEAAGRIEQSWSIKDEDIRRFLVNLIGGVLDKVSVLMQQLTSASVYICPKCFKRYSEDDALMYDYKCPLDKTPLEYINPADYLTVLGAVESRLKKMLESVSRGSV